MLTNCFTGKEIEKSLVHKSNLKKKYFKLLEKEGQAVPEKKSKDDEETKTKKVCIINCQLIL